MSVDTFASPVPDTTAPPVPVLAATEITVRFGGLPALSGVGLEVPPGTIVGLVGPNGAGKSTLFAVLSGLLRPATGRVFLRGEDVTRASPNCAPVKGWLAPSSNLSCSWPSPSASMWCWPIVSDLPAIGCGATCWIRTRCCRPQAETERVDQLLELLDLTRVARASVRALPSGRAAWWRSPGRWRPR